MDRILDTLPIAIGDRVTVNGEPGYTGTVLLIVLGPGMVPSEYWLDGHPGANGGYRWVWAHFTASWPSDRPDIHAVDIVPADRVQRVHA